MRQGIKAGKIRVRTGREKCDRLRWEQKRRLLVKSNPTWSGINTAPVIVTVSCKNTDIVARSPLTPIDSGASVEWWDPLNMAATLVTFQHIMGRLPIYVYGDRCHYSIRTGNMICTAHAQNCFHFLSPPTLGSYRGLNQSEIVKGGPSSDWPWSR